jgi:hypothetical protein
MARFGFCGGSYKSFSSVIDAEECMNRYPEAVESAVGRSAMSLIPKEGLKMLVSLPAGNGQQVLGVYTFNGRTFTCGVIIPTQQVHLYEILAGGILKDWGSLGAPLTSAPGIFAANPNQLVFTVAGTGFIYVFTFATNVLSKAMSYNNGVATNQPVTGVAAIGYIDGFFVNFFANSNNFQVSNAEDGTSWDAINIAAVSEFSDNIVAMIVVQRTVWFLGNKAIVPYYDAGGLFPLIPVPGTYIEDGAIAAYGAVKIDNTLCWIGGNLDQGQGIAWRMNGYSPQRISTHAVETAWQAYPTLTDAISFSYQVRGHKFWEIYFPSANATWVYDIATQLWHRRGTWNPNKQAYTAHKACCATFNPIFGIVVGDPTSGSIYTLSPANLTDNGTAIRRMRRAPYIAKEHEVLHHKQLEVLCDSGGQANVAAPSDAMVTLFLADPTGAVWQFEITDAGTIPAGTAAPAGQIASSPILADNVNQSTFWLLGATVEGILTSAPIAYGRADIAVLPMATNNSFMDSGLQVNQQGVVSAVAPIAHMRAPRIDMRFSDDGARTWSNVRTESIGQTGEYKKRVRWLRLGKSRNRVYEVVDSDPVNITFVDAFVKTSPDNPKSFDRLSSQLAKQA